MLPAIILLRESGLKHGVSDVMRIEVGGAGTFVVSAAGREVDLIETLNATSAII